VAEAEARPTGHLCPGLVDKVGSGDPDIDDTVLTVLPDVLCA